MNGTVLRKPALDMAKRRARRERTVRVLKMIAVGALIIGIGAAPSPRAMGKLLAELALGDNASGRKSARRKIQELKKRGLLAKHGVRYAVSDKGKQVLARERVLSLQIPKPPRWDDKWHFILFDIPLTESYARQMLNKALTGIGLVQYQQSVLVYPYPIKETVLQICRFYKVTHYTSFISANEIDGADQLKKHFRLH